MVKVAIKYMLEYLFLSYIMRVCIDHEDFSVLLQITV